MDKPVGIRENIALAPLSGYQTGGPARFFLETADQELLQDALLWAQNEGLDVFFLGGGTNVLFPDEPLNRLVIHWCRKGIWGDDDDLSIGAGENLQNVVDYALDTDIKNYAWAAGLPGSVGAAVRGNVGAFGNDLSHLFHSADCLRLENPSTIISMTHADMLFAYRHSQVKTWNALVLHVRLKRESGTKVEMENERSAAERNLEFRNQRHPLNYPNCGSVFKNINDPEVVAQLISHEADWEYKNKQQWHGKIPAAAILEAVGLKGFQIGKAAFSDLHANFIINRGKATSRDVLGLIQKAQKTVEQRFGVTLTPEIQILKNTTNELYTGG